MRKLPLVFLVACLPLWMGTTCSQQRTPQATMFATLEAAAAGIDSFRASYEAAHQSGQITLAQKQQADRAFNKANDAIIAAAKALRAGQVVGMGGATTEEVNRAVQEMVELITTLIPPQPR